MRKTRGNVCAMARNPPNLSAPVAPLYVHLRRHAAMSLDCRRDCAPWRMRQLEMREVREKITCHCSGAPSALAGTFETFATGRYSLSLF